MSTLPIVSIIEYLPHFLGHVGDYFGHGLDLAGLCQVVHYGAVSIDAELFSGHLGVLARQEYVR